MTKAPGSAKRFRYLPTVRHYSSFAGVVLAVLLGASMIPQRERANASEPPPPPPSTAGALATPSAPIPVRGGRVVGAAPSDIQAKAAGLADGDTLELQPGSYQGAIRITANGTTIRSASPNAAVFVNDGRLILEGSSTLVHGLVFQSTIAPVIDLRGTGELVMNNLFSDVGDGRDGSSVGVITIHNPTPGWEGSASPDGLNPPIVPTADRVEGNSFIRPRNTVYWQSHGVTNNAFTHNTVQGPHGIGGPETMAIKLGFGFGAEDTYTDVSYNTINDWTAWPYVIGVKSSSSRIANNLLSKGRIQIRYGHRNTVSGNVILDGDIHAGGDANMITDNYVRTIHPVDDFGPLALFGRSGLVNAVGDYSGTNGRPPFIMEFSNGQVSGNTLISAANDIGTISNVWYDNAILEYPMRTTTFRNNRLFRNAPSGFLATSMRNWQPTGPINRQTFIDNVFNCPGACDAAQLPQQGGGTPEQTATSVASVAAPTAPSTTGAASTPNSGDQATGASPSASTTSGQSGSTTTTSPSVAPTSAPAVVIADAASTTTPGAPGGPVAVTTPTIPIAPAMAAPEATPDGSGARANALALRPKTSGSTASTKQRQRSARAANAKVATRAKSAAKTTRRQASRSTATKTRRASTGTARRSVAKRSLPNRSATNRQTSRPTKTVNQPSVIAAKTPGKPILPTASATNPKATAALPRSASTPTRSAQSSTAKSAQLPTSKLPTSKLTTVKSTTVKSTTVKSKAPQAK